MNKDTPFVCTYCGHRFSFEERYLKHRCKQMVREEQFKTPIGQQAWLYYQKWMKASHKLVPQVKAFLHSKFYGSFIRFAEFVQRSKIPDPDMYISLMVDIDMAPAMWTSDPVYALFIEHLDKKISPSKHAQITINTLFTIAENAQCDVSEVFNTLQPNDMIQLLRQRKLSPWLLLQSKKFKIFLTTKLTKEQRIILETIVRPHIWQDKLKKNQQHVIAMRKYVQELNL